MEKALTKLGSFTISRKAKKELSAIGDDISVSARLAAISLFSLPFLRNQLLAAIALDPLPLISTLPWGGRGDELLYGCGNARSSSPGS